MYKFGTTKRFDKALKLCRKRGYPIEELRKAIVILVENGSLPSEYKPHILHGTMKVNGRRILDPWLYGDIRNLHLRFQQLYPLCRRMSPRPLNI